MTAILFCLPTASDRAVLTTGSEAPDMPAANVLTRQPTNRWRALDLDVAWIQFDLGAPTLIRAVWIGYSNATAAAQMRVRAAATAGDVVAAPAYDSGLLPHFPCADGDAPPADLDGFRRVHGWLWLPEGETFTHWRIDVYDPTNPAGYYQAGRVYLAAGWQPPQTQEIGAGVGTATDTDAQRGAAGQTFVAPGGKWREGSFTLSAMHSDHLRVDGERLIRVVGSDRDLLIVEDPDARAAFMRRAWYCRLVDLRPVVHSAASLDETVVSWSEWEMP